MAKPLDAIRFRMDIDADTGSYIHFVELWPGLLLSLNRIHVKYVPCPSFTVPSIITMNCCIEGRCEAMISDDLYIYMERGLCCLDDRIPLEGFHYPGSLYDGIELYLDLRLLQHHPIPALEAYGITTDALQHLLKDGGFCGQLKPETLSMATALFERLLRGHTSLETFRFYAMELLFHLLHDGYRPMENALYATKGQRRIVNEVEAIITSDLSRRYTISDLAGRYGLADSTLKKYFRKVYGMTFTDYLRNKRLGLATRLLADTKESIGEIAARCGYTNQGKFGEVFRREVGQTPLEYRRLHINETHPTSEEA
ncbi:MAG: AraC family transcriptional regulator [Lachnospiraceae bacterium]|nr:AraC family transcriptional regulator [Lachnospiraceae bacterium]